MYLHIRWWLTLAQLLYSNCIYERHFVQKRAGDHQVRFCANACRCSWNSDAPTKSEWSAIILPIEGWLILEVWWYYHYAGSPWCLLCPENAGCMWLIIWLWMPRYLCYMTSWFLCYWGQAPALPQHWPIRHANICWCVHDNDSAREVFYINSNDPMLKLRLIFNWCLF